jgi:hypothetical protein
MNEQDKKIATTIIGTLVGVLAWIIIRDSGFSLFAISLLAPKLEGGGLMAPGNDLAIGPLDIAAKVLNLVTPALTAYVFVVSKIGGYIIALVAKIVTAFQQRATLAIDAKKFASAAKVTERLDAVAAREAVQDERIAKLENILLANGAQKLSESAAPKPTPKPKVDE